MVVLDAMEKSANVELLQTELNDSPGVCLKLQGPVGDVRLAVQAAEQMGQKLETPVTAHMITAPAAGSSAAYEAAPDF